MGAGGVQRLVAARVQDPQDRVAAVMAEHGRALLRVANQWSLCHDDALDAYQRALEIFLKRLDTVDPATEGAWLRVVVKHEAMAIRRSRQGTVGSEDVDFDAHLPAAQRSTEEVVAGGERVSRSAEALRALKPDEARALLLKAEGLSYHEIGERCGWSYTKVNRAITEGRRRFMQAYAAIESGDECERFGPVLAALARGTATSAELVEVRPHLRHCIACRATVRELHMSGLRRIKLLIPAFVLAPLRWLRGSGSGSGSEDEGDLPLCHPAEAILRESEIPSTATDAGGRLMLDLPERVENGRRFRIGNIKDEIAALLQRANSSDVAACVHIASAGGGGRVASIAAVIGFCVSGVGAGALCVATGVVKAPEWVFNHDEAKPRGKPKRPKPTEADRRRAHLDSSVRFAEVAATPIPTPTATPAPRRERTERRRRPPASVDPSQGTLPTSQESAPISPAPVRSTSEFSPEQQATTGRSDPAYAPATGGGEFTP